jgi:cysteine desulfurase/selenocysteine lyase
MLPLVTRPFDAGSLRAEFPAFERLVNGAPLAYLDSASTTQKPRAVIDAMVHAMSATANIHRGVHTLSVEATAAYEGVRGKVARLLHAADPREIVFVRGTTEAINLVAQSFGRANVRRGDEVLVTALEHHSNLVPWQALCAERGAELRVLPIDDRGDVILDRLDALLGPRTRLVAVAHVSNSLGTVLPVAEITRRAHAAGAAVLVDGAQAVAHAPVDVQAIGCDFYAFSAHKMYGPTGAGVLYGKLDRLASMPAWQHGGDMVLTVSFERTTFREVPHKLEAGTPDILGVIGLGAAVDWLSATGMDRIAAREAELLAYATRALTAVPGLRILGTSAHKASAISFLLGDLHPHDVGTALDLEGIAVRTGHHCTQPVMDHFGVPATVRASFGAYTTETEIDRLAAALDRARRTLGDAS